MDEPETLEGALSSICCDLVSERRFELFLLRLFASPMGTWRNVAEYCDGLAEVPRHAADVFSEYAESLVVTHLEYPERDCPAFELILFFHKDNLWSMTAAYDRERLLISHTKK